MTSTCPSARKYELTYRFAHDDRRAGESIGRDELRSSFEQRDSSHPAHRRVVGTTVEITGDFTQWDPVRLTRGSDGSWTAVFPISAGTHQLNVRVDGGAWRVPPGLLAATDEFGGAVGILTIE